MLGTNKRQVRRLAPSVSTTEKFKQYMAFLQTASKPLGSAFPAAAEHSTGGVQPNIPALCCLHKGATPAISKLKCRTPSASQHKSYSHSVQSDVRVFVVKSSVSLLPEMFDCSRSTLGAVRDSLCHCPRHCFITAEKWRSSEG